jgi:hypothetical protein
MSEIGCCQDYEKCSDAMKCLHIGDSELHESEVKIMVNEVKEQYIQINIMDLVS